MINAAVVGLGRWGRNMVGAINGRTDRLRFTHCVVRRPQDAREFAAQHGLTIATRLADVLADAGVHAIVLTTPHSLHAEQVLAAAAAGKPVFCEKPLALKHADAKRSVDACLRVGVPLGLGHDKRYFASMRELKRLVEAGTLGEILHVEGHFSNESTRRFYAGWRENPHESPGGGITATGIHILDAFVNLIGPVRRAAAQLIERPPAPDPVDTLSVLLEFENRVSGVLCGVRSTAQYWRVHVFGTQGSAEALGDRELIVRMCDQAPQRLQFERVDTLRCELEAFADAIEGRAPFPISAGQMLYTIAALEAILESIRTQRPVPVRTSA
jgi:predicted dehydrogenase